MSEWQTMESAPRDGTVFEAMNGLMQFPIDVRWGEYTSPGMSEVFGKPMRYTGWHCPHTHDLVVMEFWRPKTTDDRLGPFRFEPIVEFPPLPKASAA